MFFFFRRACKEYGISEWTACKRLRNAMFHFSAKVIVRINAIDVCCFVRVNLEQQHHRWTQNCHRKGLNLWNMNFKCSTHKMFVTYTESLQKHVNDLLSFVRAHELLNIFSFIWMRWIIPQSIRFSTIFSFAERKRIIHQWRLYSFIDSNVSIKTVYT